MCVRARTQWEPARWTVDVLQLACPGFTNANLGVDSSTVPVAPRGLSGQAGRPCCSRPIGVTPLECSSASWSPWTLLSELTLTVPLEYSLWPASVSKIPLANPLFSSSLGQRNRPQWGSWSWMRDVYPPRHFPWGQAKTDWAHHFSGWTLVSRHFFFFNLKIY